LRFKGNIYMIINIISFLYKDLEVCEVKNSSSVISSFRQIIGFILFYTLNTYSIKFIN
jgi:hypothetical protein